MSDPSAESEFPETVRRTEPELAPMQIFKHGLFFAITFATTLIAGMLWQMERDLLNIAVGLPYSLSLLFILSCHEFGHYFAARYHRVRVTLPYYIPIPPLSGVDFGTLGAVIRTKEPIPNRKALFDIGIAGPIAGFIASIIVLMIGFLSLPGKEFILSMHPDFDFAINTVPGLQQGGTLVFGAPLLYQWMQSLFSASGAWIPPMWEMYHYPYLITGWFGLLITALNLLPAGQLDGGHVLYALIGRKHAFVARMTIAVLLILGLMAVFPYLLGYIGNLELAVSVVESFDNFWALFWPGWLMWVLILLFVIKVDHPQVEQFEELGAGRIALGVFAGVMFLVCVVPAPIFFQ